MIKLQAKQFKSKPNALKGWLLLTILSFSYGFANAGGIDVHNKERIENKVALSETTATVLKAAEEAGHAIEKALEELPYAMAKKVTIIEKKGGEISIVVEGAGKITTTEELIAFLDEVTETTIVNQLEVKGIKSFFRGTTRSKIDGSLFSGNTTRIFTSTDPVKSTIFAIESATSNGTYKGVLQMGLPSDFKNLALSAPNRRVSLELEVVFNTTPENFANASKVEISIENAKKVVKEVYGIDLPSTLNRGTAYDLLNALPASTLDKSFEFYQKALKYNVE